VQFDLVGVWFSGFLQGFREVGPRGAGQAFRFPESTVGRRPIALIPSLNDHDERAVLFEGIKGFLALVHANHKDISLD
jgi:hypothetical protein